MIVERRIGVARNKYPEVTVEKILEVSQRLFLEKGYDNTTIQDIVNELVNSNMGVIFPGGGRAFFDVSMTVRFCRYVLRFMAASGTAQVFWISGSDDPVVLLEASDGYSETLTLPEFISCHTNPPFYYHSFGM